MLAGQGDRLPVSAFPVDGTWPTGTAQWEKRNIALEIPVWDAAALHPVQQVRAGLPARGDPRQGLRRRRAGRRAGDVQARRRARDRTARAAVHAPGRAGRLHRLRALRRCLPGEGQEPIREHKAHRHGAAAAAARAEREQLRLLPRPAGGRPHARSSPTSRARSSSQPLFEFSGACAGCGETPYLKLLTQLFGDRAGHRERHRLLVDLRRQPADDAVHDEPRRPRAGVGELAVRGQRRVRPRACGWRSISTSEHARDAARAARAATVGDDLAEAICSTPISRPRRASRRSASASTTLRATARGDRHRPDARDLLERSPTTW